MVFTFKGQLDAFSEKQFKTFVTNNLENDLPFVINLGGIKFIKNSFNKWTIFMEKSYTNNF